MNLLEQIFFLSHARTLSWLVAHEKVRKGITTGRNKIDQCKAIEPVRLLNGVRKDHQY